MNMKVNQSRKATAIFAERVIKIIYGSSEPLTFIIKAHLMVDAFLTMIIEGSFLRPDKLKTDRLTYDTKLCLCEAFGLVHSDVVPVLQKLGKLRNKFAHKLWSSIEKLDTLNFINTLKQSDLLRKQYLKKINVIKGDHNLQDALYVLCMYLFEQLLRTASAKKHLQAFRSMTVDESVIQGQSINMMSIIGPLNEAESNKLFGKSAVKKLKTPRKKKKS